MRDGAKPRLSQDSGEVRFCRSGVRDRSGVVDLFIAPRFIPESQLDAVPQAELVVDQAQIVLDHVLGGAERIGDLAILAALGYALDDEVFTFTGRPEACLSCHNCLL